MNLLYRFGRFELNPATRQLLAAGQPLPLGARAFDVLLVLIERRDRMVTKDELLELAWPGVVVEENNLQVQISALRKILGVDAIATVPGRGYRFASELSAIDHSVAPAKAPAHNLPRPLTSFIGHEDDLREYADLLGQSRLLTLTGIGGCGKSRLAIRLAETVVPSFRDGVWFVDLASLSDAERLPLTVATTLGIRKRADQPPMESLCKHLADRHLLLVLDNCEHLIAACAELTQQLLNAAPGMRVLVTSREGLNVPGERTVTVRSLALPAIGSERDIPGLKSSEAVRLFDERAQLAVTKFSFDATTAPAVAEICRRLDGIPLAIELAAARVKVLSVEEIRARLDDRFRLLSGGHNSALARQQTLLGTIQWSYDHLAPDEARLLRLLAVFAGGWTLAAAVRVIGDNADEYEVLDLLTRLVDRSLVTIDRTVDSTTRYAMLETVRQYAQERLNQTTEGNAARLRHLQFFVALAEEAAPELGGSTQKLWLVRLNAELENLLRAQAWCDHVEGGAELGLRLARALFRFWFHSGLMGLGHREVLVALGRTGAAAKTRAMALVAACSLSISLDRYPEAQAQAAQMLSIARDLGDHSLTAEALRQLGYVAGERGDSALALELYEEAHTLARELKDQAMISGILNGKGEVHRGAGNMEQARQFYEEALVLARKQGNMTSVANICDNLARALMALGQPERALDLVTEVVAISATGGSKWTALCAFDITAALAALAGNWPFAARMRGAAEARVKNLKFRRDRADEAFLEPWTMRIQETLSEDTYRAAYDSGYALPHEQAVAEAQAWLSTKPNLQVTTPK